MLLRTRRPSWHKRYDFNAGLVLVFLRIYVDLAVFQPYLDLEAGDNQSLKIQVARPGIEPRSSCSASQELNHSATTAPMILMPQIFDVIANENVRYKRNELE